MEVLVVAIVVVFVLIMGFKAVAGYGSYKGSLYQRLFGSYLEYFWRMRHEGRPFGIEPAQRGASARIASSTTPTATARGASPRRSRRSFPRVGMRRFAMVATAGAIAGKDTGSWTVERDGKKLALASPVTYVRRQKKLLDSFLKNAPVEYIIAFNEGADVSAVECSYTVLTIDRVLDHLAEKPEGTVAEADVVKAFETFKEMAVHAG